MTVSSIHRFDQCELRPSERALFIGGKPVTLGGRAFDLLVALVERAGRLVGKDELLDVVWGRVIVEEANLHVHISALRKLLGPRVIATIPGRGYRFEATLADGAPAPAATRAAAASETRRDGRPADLFGRDDDLADLQRLLQAHRLVTIAGPGGIGKTRLARALLTAASDRHTDGAVMVELAPLTDPALIPGAIAAALRLPLASSQDPLSAILAAMRPLSMLLVLDNAEHLIDGVARVVDALVADDSAVTVLVTSQVSLKVPGEQVFRLGRLAIPVDDAIDPDAALAFGAVALFNERVRAIDRRFALCTSNLPLVLSICRRLDGIALAIELAAARCPLLGLNVVAARLDERFRLLKGGARTAPSRQQTLQAAMDWSYGLLDAEQQIAFRQLGPFAGGFSLALARQVLDQPGVDEWGSVDLLAALIERSLVTVDPQSDNASRSANDAPRYRLLETGRAYALDRLAESGEFECERIRGRHASAMRALFETAYDDCWVLPEAGFIARYEPELDNLRAALDWSMQHSPADAIALMGASGRLWRWLSLHPEAIGRAHAAAALIDARTPPAIAARLWESIAQLSGEISSVDSRPAARNALALYQQLGDARGRYLALAHIAFSFRWGSDEAEAAHTTMQQLEDPRWPPSVRLLGTKVSGGLASDARRIDEARAAHEARLRLATAAGSEREINAALGNLADLALIAGDAAAAVERGRELLARLGRRHMATRAIALGNLLLALLAKRAPDDAREVLAQFIEVSRQLGDMYLMYAADAMAWLGALEGRSQAAAMLLGYADAAYAAQSQPREPNEASAREMAWGLLSVNVEADSIRRLLAEGAALSPADVCALALAR